MHPFTFSQCVFQAEEVDAIAEAIADSRAGRGRSEQEIRQAARQFARAGTSPGDAARLTDNEGNRRRQR
jgi:hypothetical protein